MYAIIADGSHQYRVEPGTIFHTQIKPDMPLDAKAITFDRILLVGDMEGGPKVGQPIIPGATVSATILLNQVKGEKIIIQKFRRRKKYAKKKGHRQRYMEVRVDQINL